MSIMETREELEEASTEEQVAEIRRLNKGSSGRALSSRSAHQILSSVNVADTTSQLAAAFAASPPNLDAAKNLVIQLRYLENVDGVCKEWTPGRRIELEH